MSAENSGDRRTVFTYWLLAAVLMLLFIVFTQKNYLLGDGFSAIGNVAAGLKFSPTEPMAYYWYHTIYLLTPGGKEGATLAYTLSAYLAGGLFLVSLFAYLNKRGHLLLALVISLSFGTMQFFFGYAENYTFSFVFAFSYIMSAETDLERRRISMTTILWLLLAISFHISNFLLVLSFIYLIFIRFPSRTVKIALLSILCLLGIFGIVFVGKYMSLKQVLVPPVPIADNQYHLFSTAHIKDMINIVWLCYPLVFLAPFFRKEVSGQTRRFFQYAIIPALLFTFVIDPKIGAFRDWDLLSIASAPVLCLLL